MNRLITLDDVRPLDMFGCPPDDFWEKKACKLMKSSIFHVGCFVEPVYDPGTLKITDWMTSESINTGVDFTRLGGRHVRVYRRTPDSPVTPYDIRLVHSECGALPYGWAVNLLTAAWFISTYYLHKPFPYVKVKSPNCVKWYATIRDVLGCPVVPADQYVIEKALEDNMEYIGDLNISE